MNTHTTLLVLSNWPDQSSANLAAHQLINKKLAACINIMSPCRSLYHWQGQVEEAQEVPMLIKTTTARYAALEKEILAQHPYETPEIIAIPITQGLPDYLNWVEEETSPASDANNII